MTRRHAFTLIELLIVITIILAVSALALPTIVPALSHRQVSESARLIQAVLSGARDDAIRTGRPAGVRLLPAVGFTGIGAPTLADGKTPNPFYGILDPTQPLAYDRLIPITTPPDYTTGLVSVYPTADYSAVTGGRPALVLEQCAGRWVSGPGGWTYQPVEPTSWAWNIRVGDRVQIGSGSPYTVIGPTVVGPAGGNADRFVNAPPLSRVVIAPDGTTAATAVIEYLILVNGVDDNGDGYTDPGFDGIAETAGSPIDGPLDWTMETEKWQGPLARGAVGLPYAIQRRPAPTAGGREVSLPTNIVIDATTWATTRARSHLPTAALDPTTGLIDLVVYPDGTIVPTTLYSAPTSVGMDSAFVHLWLAERSDVGTGAGPAGEWALVTVTCRTGRVSTTANPDPTTAFALAQQGLP